MNMQPRVALPAPALPLKGGAAAASRDISLIQTLSLCLSLVRVRHASASPIHDIIIDFIVAFGKDATGHRPALSIVATTHPQCLQQYAHSRCPFPLPDLAHTHQVAKQYTRLIALWPKDALRPNLPFTRAIEHRGVPYGVEPLPRPDDAQEQKKKITSIASEPAAPTPLSPQAEQAQINALFSLLENRYSNKYALSQSVFEPRSAPDHYTNLMREIEKAPQKTWWQAKVDEWKMKIRWQ
jgi:cytochrome b pre-mRNA-processing protein 6